MADAGNTPRYLELISQHLQEHHAALLVGSGFSRNAVKVNPDVPDIPLWDDLRKIFRQKLDPTQEREQELGKADPLTLAEHVEIAYGRPELDRLLLNSIRDSDYQPSQLHRKLLQLPWSDIFTTNYDTLLERAGNELTERAFSIISCKDDLVGSSGATRIIKLHGSFPSQRPFIITSEDYRTYPCKFAPFVNTMQQSLLENTLCMIGFSGDDPNFNNWIGWIRDNLGTENTPYMYLLLHHPLSNTRREWLCRRNIIPVDLSEIFPESSGTVIYEKAFDHLWNQYLKFKETRQNWKPDPPIHKSSPQPLSVKEALHILRQNHKTCPQMLTLPGEQLEYLRSSVVSPASQILTVHCDEGKSDTDNELEYLYEYDWLRGKALLPLFASDLKCYQEILDRHREEHNAHKVSIRLSVLRTLRECGDWVQWEDIHRELHLENSYLTQDQLHQFKWEECLFSLSRYEFQTLKQQLENWDVSVDMPLWVLRKAGLWAEYGECERAHGLLQQAILDLRKRLSHQPKPDFFLLSLESAMMYLQGFISQARLDSSISAVDKEEKQKENAFIDAQHRARHKQYHVSWEDQNAYFAPRLEAVWVPFRNHQTKATFDFGRSRTSIQYREDKDRILAFSFLRFREETGIPFLIRNVYSGKKAACGAAERIALYTPEWAILTLVRTDEPKAVENVVTRGVLSSWTQEDTDQRCQLYLDAVFRTKDELTIGEWFYRNSFARLAADVLPEVLSELCSKCSVAMMDKLLHLLEELYASPKKLCYQQTASLTKRLIPVYPASARRELLIRLIRFPLIGQDKDVESSYFPDPIQFVSLSSGTSMLEAQTAVPEIQVLLSKPPSTENRNSVLDRLLHCFYCGLLTVQQKVLLGGLLWNNGELQIPGNWLRTICLNFPEPQDIDMMKYLSEHITENIEGYTDWGVRANNDETVLLELSNFSFANAGSFSAEQVSAIFAALFKRIDSLSHNLSEISDFMGKKRLDKSQIYRISHALWILTTCKKGWIPTSEDQQVMSDILNKCEAVNINHHGLKSVWLPLLNSPFSAERNLEQCLRSVDELCSHYGYKVLAAAIRHQQFPLLHVAEMHAGITVMAQQIAWCIPKQLTNALQTAAVAVEHQPSLLCSDILELISTGLFQLREQTVITEDDTTETASEKGIIRKNAVILARKLYQAGLRGERPEILEEWLKVIQDSNEFAEIREAE